MKGIRIQIWIYWLKKFNILILKKITKLSGMIFINSYASKMVCYRDYQLTVVQTAEKAEIIS